MNPDLGSDIAELQSVNLQPNEDITRQNLLYYQDLVEQLLDLFMTFGSNASLRNILEKVEETLIKKKILF